MKVNTNELKRAVKRSPYFDSLDETSISLIIKDLIIKSFLPGEFIIWEGDPARGIFIINSGWLKVTKFSTSGRELILNILGPGDSFNTIAMFTGKKNPANVVALEKSQLLFLDYETLQSVLDRSPGLSTALLVQFASRIHTLTDMIGTIYLTSVETRLATLLLEKAPSDVFLREKWLTQEELAALIGTVPDVVSRVLRNFVEQGLIEFDRKQITILNRNALIEKSEGI